VQNKKQYFVVIDERDNVATAVRDAVKGEVIETNLRQQITLLEDIPKGHKVAIRDIAANEPIIKYGEVICLAKRNIRKGEHVHIHNITNILTEYVEAWKSNEI